MNACSTPNTVIFLGVFLSSQVDSELAQQIGQLQPLSLSVSVDRHTHSQRLSEKLQEKHDIFTGWTLAQCFLIPDTEHVETVVGPGKVSQRS